MSNIQDNVQDNINHPKHYTQYSMEVIDMMIQIWGVDATVQYCEMNAFKYRMRMGVKNTPIMEDLGKEQWYLNRAKLLRSSEL